MSARSSLDTPRWLKLLLIGGAIGYVLLVLLLPLAAVFAKALRKGLATYSEALREPDAQADQLRARRRRGLGDHQA